MTNITDIAIHQATINELERIVPIFNQYRVFYERESDRKQAERFIKERLIHQQSVIFFANDIRSDRSVGFAQLYPSFSSLSMQKIWILNDLFVLPEARRRGVGRALLEAARDFAHKTEAKGLSLTTGVENKVAQQLYESFGFEKDEAFFSYFYTL